MILIPCCHTFCSVCMEKKLSNLLCYDCGNRIQDSRPNIATLHVLEQANRSILVKEVTNNEPSKKRKLTEEEDDEDNASVKHRTIEQSSKTNFQRSITKIEPNLKLFTNEHGLKLKEHNEKLDQIDKQIENRVNQLLEIIFQNHLKLTEKLKKYKLELKQQLREISNEEIIKTKLDLIKSDQNNSDTMHLNDDLNIIMQQINIKFNNLEQFKFEIKFKQNDLITENREDFIGLLIEEKTIIETLLFAMRADTSLLSTVD